MAGFKIPVFERGTVLTQEMLETLKSYAIDLATLEYAGYEDGIISGCQVSMLGNMIYVNRGIIKYAGNIYFLPCEFKVMANTGNQWQILRMHVGSMSRDTNFMIGELNLEISSELSAASNKIEICRFRLQGGAVLRNQYRDFNDLSTEFDTINEIHAQWAGYQCKSISNRVLTEYAKEIQKKNSQNIHDVIFIQQIMMLNGKTMARNAILYYISQRLNRPQKEMSNEEIYKALQEILRTSRMAGNAPTGGMREMRRIIVD